MRQRMGREWRHAEKKEEKTRKQTAGEKGKKGDIWIVATIYESGNEMQSWGFRLHNFSPCPRLALMRPVKSGERHWPMQQHSQHQGRCRDGTLEHNGVYYGPLFCVESSAGWSQDPGCINYRRLSISYGPALPRAVCVPDDINADVGSLNFTVSGWEKWRGCDWFCLLRRVAQDWRQEIQGYCSVQATQWFARWGSCSYRKGIIKT